MTFEEATAIVKDFGGGRLLEGLEFIRDELDRAFEEEDFNPEVTVNDRLAYLIVLARMRPLFA